MVFTLGFIAGVVVSLVAISALILYSAAQVDKAIERGTALEQQTSHIKNLRPSAEPVAATAVANWSVDATTSAAVPNR
jgi:hypothetical protein